MDSAIPVVKSPMNFIVRCFAEKKDDQWQAFSLEFGLAVQGDTRDEVVAKLDSMISGYVEDALGQDRQFARSLMSRQARLPIKLKYFMYRFVSKIRAKHESDTGIVFDEPLRLAPVAGCMV